MSAFNVGKKVSAAVRILQRNRDASARATHLVVKKYPLITYEKALLGQATGGKFPSVTFLERKKMSSKTSFKRIALVAASALALAGFSAVPAHAASASVTLVKTSAAKSTVIGVGTLVISTGTTASDTATAAGFTFVAGDVGKSLYSGVNGFIGTISGFTSATVVTLAAAAVGGNITHPSAKWYIATAASTTTASGVVANEISGLTVNASAASLLNLKYDAATAATTGVAKATIGGTLISSAVVAPVSGDLNLMLPITAPVTAGTYSVLVTYDNSGTYSATSPSFTFTLTVTANAGLSTALSTAYMAAAGTAAAAYTSTTNAVPRSGAKETGTDLASIEITLKNSDGTAHAAQPTITATVAGSGYVLVDTTATTTAVGTLRASTGAAATSGLAYVHVDADGTSGTGTVTVSVTDSVTLVTTVLGTFTVTSYGAAAKIEVSTTNYNIGRAGGFTTGGAVAARSVGREALGATDQTTVVAAEGTGVSTPAFIIKVTDSAGNLVNLTNSSGVAIVPTITSDTLTTSGGGTCVLDNGSSTTYSSGAGVGYYNCNFSSAASSVSGGKATLTVKTPNPADTTLNLTATVAITVGGKIATETITTDATSYDAGAGMTITQSAVDASGNKVFDGAASPAIKANKALGGTTPGAGFYVGGTINSDTSKGAKTVFAPAVGGTLTLQETSSNTAGSTITASVDINGDASASLSLDAANAATDAANNAYDEAQNATQAASDALAAVTALSAQVSALIATVKSLAAMVAKIKAKVKA